jgi:uncharacterized protein (DUF1697 family)
VTATHVALIRGINVGGKNPVPMVGLREALTAAGFEDVRTYIQSGNVVMDAPGRTEVSVNEAVESVLENEFGVSTVVVTLNANALRTTVKKAPKGFGSDDAAYRYDVIFVRPGIDPSDVLPRVRLREGVDDAWAGERALYFRRLEALRTKSLLNRVLDLPEYRSMTIRNWKTTMALHAMLRHDSH